MYFPSFRIEVFDLIVILKLSGEPQTGLRAEGLQGWKYRNCKFPFKSSWTCLV